AGAEDGGAGGRAGDHGRLHGGDHARHGAGAADRPGRPLRGPGRPPAARPRPRAGADLPRLDDRAPPACVVGVMSPRLLVCGFGPFPGVPENPAMLTVERLRTERWAPPAATVDYAL